jgi:flagellar motor switch protein FliN
MNREVSINEKDLSLVGHVKVSLAAQVGNTEMTVDELFALKKQDVLRLDQPADAVVTLLLNGKPIARGELVAVDDNLGVRITELI